MKMPLPPDGTLRVLTERDCLAIHAAAEKILMRTGVLVDHEPARELLRKAGAAVEGALVRVPPGLVKTALHTAPNVIVLHDRDGRPAMRLGDGRSYFGTGSDTAFTIDPDTGASVPTTRHTVERFTRFTDALPHIDFVMSMGIAQDHGDASFVAQMAAMMANTRKPLVFTAQGLGDIEAIHDILAAVCGGAEEVRLQPRAMLYTEPVSPLRHTEKELAMLLFCAEHSLPVTVPSGINAGATGPVTLAGALALANAETLSALVIHQLARPGAPYLYGGNVTAMDMHSGNYPYAAPEFHLAFAAFADLARHYRLPVWGLAGASDSKALDAQAGAEAAYELFMALLSGSHLVHDVGYLNSGLTSSMEMLLLCDELIAMVRRLGDGIVVNDETLALDVIHQVGPMQQYLDHEHTVRHCRDVWTPRFLNRDQPEVWAKAGSKEIGTVLRERVREILATHVVPPLPEAVQRRVDAIVAARRQAAH